MTKLVGKENIGTIADPKKFRTAQLCILDKFVEICNKHNLRYFLSGGTLLGAVRHKGFIPWDDDIDVMMPRPDLEKLIKITDRKIGAYTLCVPDADNPYPYSVYKIYDESFIIEDKEFSDEVFYLPLFIDIFPIEGLPANEHASKKFIRKSSLKNILYKMSYHDGIYGKSAMAKLFHAILYPYVKIAGRKRLAEKLNSYVQKYDYNTSEYVGVVLTRAMAYQERIERKGYINSVDVEFEGKMYKAPESYKQYLINLYGDYMQLPPADQQVANHSFRIYEAKNIIPEGDVLV